MTPMLYLLTSVALSGRLAEGWRHLSWGEQAPFAAPGAACTHEPEVGTLWACHEKVGEADVLVFYGYDHGYLNGLVISGEGYEVCSELRRVLVAAWGSLTPKHDWDTDPLQDGYWFDGVGGGAWSWNPYSGKCEVVAFHRPSLNAINELKASSAASSASGL